MTLSFIAGSRFRGFGQLLVAGGLLMAPMAGWTQPATAPMYQLTVRSGRAKAVNYQSLTGTTRIGFQGTVLEPEAGGSARVQANRGGTRIRARFERLAPASRFGPEYMTYVLWAVSPLGRASNLGELVLKANGKCNLEATTPLQTFALIVTAEPHFAVTKVSDLVVLENTITRATRGQVQEVEARYELLPRGAYILGANPATLEAPKPDRRVSNYVHQARNALRLAQAERAEQLAPEDFAKADELARQMEAQKKKWKRPTVALARQAVQVAEDARLIAGKRAEEERLLQLRLGAEEAQRQAQAARAETDAARMAAEVSRVEAEAARIKASQETQQARKQVSEARREASADKLALRKKLRDQLNQLLSTQDTERGLIVAMSDVFFPSGKGELTGPAREKLAKAAGIFLAYPGLKVKVEGHADSTGKPAFNAKLSERRAAVVRNYLVKQGLPPAGIVSEGLGSARPVADNDTPAGRQQNRRVELILSGEEIGF